MMTRVKMDYGIDLGTSNSAIAILEAGETKIIKSEKYLKDTTPSCVHFNKRQITFLGDDALNKYRLDALSTFAEFSRTGSRNSGMNTFIEFKRTMGTDKTYMSTHMKREYLSEELSAEVLKKLRSYVTDETVSAAAITVPAKFRQNQIDATQRASDLAGLKYCELLQEPIAASLAYGVDSKDIGGYWLVFDLGGGTFDAALMKVDEGIMKVADTAGDNHLGGKDIDYAIADHLLIPWLKKRYRIDHILMDVTGRNFLREALKWYAEEAKIAFSTRDTAEIYSDEPIGVDVMSREMELALTLTLKEYEEAAFPVFNRAVSIAQNLLKRNNVEGKELDTLLLVGGPTRSRTLRRLLEEKITDRIDTRIDPMTAVAKGAAIYASTRDIPMEFQIRDRTRVQLTLRFPETTVEIDENVGIRIDRENTDGNLPEKIFAEVIRGDGSWSSGRVCIEKDGEVVPIVLSRDRSNAFSVRLYDDTGNSLACEPEKFSIIQGLKTATATLTHSLCIGAFDTDRDKQLLLPLRGLEKNQSLPARGKEVFKLQKEIHPGNADDIIKIPIYEGEPYTRTTLNEWAGRVFITGRDIPLFLPEDAEIELTIEIDSSRRMKLRAYFPYIDETIAVDVPENRQKGYDADQLAEEILKAEETIIMLENESTTMDMDLINQFIRLNRDLCGLSELMESGRGDYSTRTKVMERLREILKEIDYLEEEGQWPRMEGALNKALERLELCARRYGDKKTNALLAQYRQQAEAIMKQKNIKAARELRKEIRSSGLALVSDEIGLWIRFVRNFHKKFDQYLWKDKVAAEKIMQEALDLIAGSPTKSRVEILVRQLFALLPEGSGGRFLSEKDEELLKK